MVEDECCSLCFEPFTNRICYLKCGHSFHLFCFSQWKTKVLTEKWTETCPLCRKFPHILLIRESSSPSRVQNHHQSPPTPSRGQILNNDSNENELFSARSKKLFDFTVGKKFSDFISNFIRSRRMDGAFQ